MFNGLRTSIRLLVLALVPLLATAGPAKAHPHVWVEAGVELIMKDDKVTALDITWLFDDFFSELARWDFDLDGSGSLSQQELDALVGVSATTLSESSFFTHLRIGEERPPVRLVRDFYIEDDGIQLLYRFRVVLPEPVDPAQTDFSVGFFDEGYYVDVDMRPEDMTIPSGCQFIPREALDQPLYFGLFFPTYYHLVCASA
ncbi:MAG: DUF1007 family protein [Pseudomonadota bacterium]